MPGGRTRRTGKHHRSFVEAKLRRDGVRRILQGATVPVLLMVASDPNRCKFSEEKEKFLQTSSYGCTISRPYSSLAMKTFVDLLFSAITRS